MFQVSRRLREKMSSKKKKQVRLGRQTTITATSLFVVCDREGEKESGAKCEVQCR